MPSTGRSESRLLVAALAVAMAAAACGGQPESFARLNSGGSPSAPSLGASALPTESPGPTATTSPTAAPNPTAPVPAFRHVYLIVMENKEYASVVGSRLAPYVNSLIARYGLATAFYAETHPSEPNYIALVSGGTQGVASDGAYNLAAPSLFDQLGAAGKTWHVYAQAYPGNCYTPYSYGPVKDGPGLPGEYVRKHNPAISFISISRNAALCAQITRLTGFDPAAADFEMIVPNQYNDMHSKPPSGTAVGVGDAFLRSFLPSILGSPAFQGSVVFITWDEGGTSRHGGGHVATIVLSPGMAPGFRSAVEYTHYSLLRTIELAWGLPLLGNAASAATMLFPY